METICGEMIALMTSGPTLHEIIRFQHSDETVQKVIYLVDAYKQGALSEGEERELRLFYKYDHFVEELKKRAYRRLQRDRNI
ncbi:MAG: hypothetical protein CL607_24885 [Anaerolineaceae bacterium]|nr:hypothetical protein [Anaerolineaceae bacterium]